ncbi:hypothetical protein LCGC14_2289530 [marine sediment metagenome]|uniref:Uncharacterized protein n=1 Tax=marine sediment metagenome TaxID=412755 RepID=A0A0F9CS47_9ZZZZ
MAKRSREENFDVSNVSSQPGIIPSTGLPAPIAVAAGQTKTVYKILSTQGKLHFVMLAVSNQDAKIDLFIDGRLLITSTPRRLWLLGAGMVNHYVWIEKFDTSNDEFALHMGRIYKFEESFEVRVTSPPSGATNILDSNIFWKRDIKERE